MRFKNEYHQVEIPFRPCKDSDAAIGVCVSKFTIPDQSYGRWCIVAYWGRYALFFDQKRKKLNACNYFACGCGG